MIAVPDQPLAERILRAALARESPPQQLLLFGPAGTGKREAARQMAWELMDPDGSHRHTAEALDLTEVEAVGQQILLRDLEEALSPDRQPAERDAAAGDDRAGRRAAARHRGRPAPAEDARGAGAAARTSCW